MITIFDARQAPTSVELGLLEREMDPSRVTKHYNSMRNLLRRWQAVLGLDIAEFDSAVPATDP